eukprot:FR734550.1.p1 GENE.FR734550.1~~FR734550.1.p1  ORF type:complete len:177 (+),score=38.16 FR734550.1:29-532(+)
MGAADLIDIVQQKKLLSKTAELGLLSKADAAGITLSDLEPLLIFADDNGALEILADLLDSPLAATAVDLAPSALPLAGALINTPPALLIGLAPLSLAAAVAEVNIIDDSSVALVAIQTILAVLLGAVVPAVSLGGAFVLGYKKCAKEATRSMEGRKKAVSGVLWQVG